jgi:hypothetical protein
MITYLRLRVLTLAVVALSVMTNGCTNAEQRKPQMSSLIPTNATTADLVHFEPAPVVPLASEAPARLIVDAPLPEQLATGYVVIRYQTQNLRILPVYGPAALAVLPRIGHLHVTVDDLPWHWLDASGEPISINGLPPGPHKVLIELEGPSHKLIDSAIIKFEIPQRPST